LTYFSRGVRRTKEQEEKKEQMRKTRTRGRGEGGGYPSPPLPPTTTNRRRRHLSCFFRSTEHFDKKSKGKCTFFPLFFLFFFGIKRWLVKMIKMIKMTETKTDKKRNFENLNRKKCDILQAPATKSDTQN